MRANLFLIALVLTGCSTFGYRSPGPYEGGSLLGRGGTYLAEIWLLPRGAEEQRFNAVLSHQPGGWLFNAVAPSGKPLFRAREKEGAPETVFTATELPLAKAQLEAFYEALRPLLLLYDRPGQPSAVVTARYPDGRPRTLAPAMRVDEYDWNGHAFRLTLENAALTARLTLREYEAGR